MLISFAVTVKLICVFDFAYAKRWFSHDVAHLCFICRILNSSTFEVKKYIEPFGAYYLFNGLLIALQLLHLMWSYMIAKIAVNDIRKGKVGVAQARGYLTLCLA